MKLDQAVRLIRQRWPEATSAAPDEPVFVLAAGWRSGSTLLQRMLLRHCLVWGEPYGSAGLIERLAQPLQRFSPEWPRKEFFLDSAHWGERLGEKWTANLYPPVTHLLEAHVEFFRHLFARPSQQRGYARWGLKEVRYGIEHAVYLRWLFPRARFLFLVRNPFICWASYRRIGARVLRFWPEELITTPEQFGRHWVQLTEGFCTRAGEVGGLLLRYEALTGPDFDSRTVETYLGFGLDAAAQKTSVGAAPPGNLVPEETARLARVVGPLASRLGYANPFA
jgi:hypothetical protein